MTPRRQEKVFKKDYGKQLLRIAEGDLESAKALHSVGGGRPENICYLAHQAIEKALKAVLVKLEQPVPLVHDLGALLAKFPQGANTPVGYEIVPLNDYAAIRRYEEGNAPLTVEELIAVLGIADSVLAWARTEVRGV